MPELWKGTTNRAASAPSRNEQALIHERAGPVACLEDRLSRGFEEAVGCVVDDRAGAARGDKVAGDPARAPWLIRSRSRGMLRCRRY